MSSRPIFVATHPRACSTAFERVFMTRRDTLNCFHEPFGDAFYFGPERLSKRYATDEAARAATGFGETTFKGVMDELLEAAAKTDKRVFIKDIIYYLFPPNGEPATVAPSFRSKAAKGSAKPGTELNGTNGVNGHAITFGEEPENPTVIPKDLLRKFHFTFLIRHPRRAIPSYWRCTIPPLNEQTGFTHYMPSEAGYDELRRLFDFLRKEQIIGPAHAGESNGVAGGDEVSITVIDADDLLDQPKEVIEAFCKAVDMEYKPEMLRWEDPENQSYAEHVFAKWPGFHNDVLSSTYLKPRDHAMKTPSVEAENEEWRKKYGEEAQKIIRQSVDDNIPHYEYLKKFALKF